MNIFNIAEPETRETLEKDEFDLWKAINSGVFTKSDLLKASKLPWLNMWVRKELRKAYARDHISRENIKLFNTLVKGNGVAANQAIKNFENDNEIEAFISFLGNMSIPAELKTKVSLSVLYPKLQFKDSD